MANLKDCVTEVTGRTIVMRGENFVYLDTKAPVEQSFLNDATVLKAKKDTEEMFGEASNEIKAMVQTKINEYNNANGLKFDSIDSLFKYTRNETYTHYNFCVGALDWNEALWEKAREIQGQVVGGTRSLPTKEEFLEELPVYQGV